MTNKFLLIVLATGLLTACSGVKLNDSATVEDKTGNKLNLADIDLVTPATPQTKAPSNNPLSNPSVVATNVNNNKASTPVEPLAKASSIIYFEYDSYDIKDDFKTQLQLQAKYILNNKQAKFVLAGHTDARGTREYNLTLGQKRADSVKQALEILGVTATQVEAISYGKEALASNGLEENDHAKNRRVELILKQ